MEQFGRYRIIRSLGRGGMAEVFEAVALGLDGFQRRVAIKRMLPDAAALEGMFLDEARIVSQLHHANIVAILDFGAAEGKPFQVFELVDGLNAQQLVDTVKGRLPEEVALGICLEIAHALDHAHTATDATGRRLRIVHRDVKPSNILISRAGDVKLGDFGIARATNRSERTAVGLTKGTVPFMPPEQLTAGEVDARSDVFALGCVLHALVTGQSPLDDSGVRGLLAGAPLPLSAALAPQIGEIVGRALQPQKHQRYQTAAEMASALGSALRDRVRDDPRSTLRRFLDGVLPKAQPRADPGPVEQEWVLGSVDHGTRSFTVSTLASTSTLPAKRRERSRRAVALTAAVGVAAVFAIASGWVGRWADTAPSAALPARGPLNETSSQAPGHQPPAPSVSPEPIEAARPAALRAPRGKASSGPASAPAIGMLQVGGDLALRAEIFIDGRPVGYGPATLEVPVGRHQIEIRSADGRRLRRDSIVVAASHTADAPLRWLVAP